MDLAKYLGEGTSRGAWNQTVSCSLYFFTLRTRQSLLIGSQNASALDVQERMPEQ
jgi:hypothetical protein